MRRVGVQVHTDRNSGTEFGLGGTGEGGRRAGGKGDGGRVQEKESDLHNIQDVIIRESIGVADSNQGCERWLNSGKLVGWLCLSPATSLVLQSAAILVSRPDQVNYLGDTTGEYGLHHVIEQNTTFASIHLCERFGSCLLNFRCSFFFSLFFLHKSRSCRVNWYRPVASR